MPDQPIDIDELDRLKREYETAPTGGGARIIAKIEYNEALRAAFDKRLAELDYRMSIPPINWKTMTDATREQTDLRREREELIDAAKVLAGVQ
jgi:aspartate/tyrosine/aromatic aminotransferase